MQDSGWTLGDPGAAHASRRESRARRRTTPSTQWITRAPTCTTYCLNAACYPTYVPNMLGVALQPRRTPFPANMAAIRISPDLSVT